MKKKKESVWDHSSHEEFYRYYAENNSVTDKALNRFRSIQKAILRNISEKEYTSRALEIADIGCGAGTQCVIWSETGHVAHGIDISYDLIVLARKRAEESGHKIDFHVGSATMLPWDDQSMDICIMLELLEHVSDWEQCLIESLRIIKTGGILFLTTTNFLCPIQEEFNLLFYSWYPKRIKEYYERLSVSSKPELANYAIYPAVNWFSYYSLQKMLINLGFETHDRFDIIDLSGKPRMLRTVVSIMRKVPILRMLGHVMSPGTMLIAFKR